jgi:hypothetical protein
MTETNAGPSSMFEADRKMLNDQMQGCGASLLLLTSDGAAKLEDPQAKTAETIAKNAFSPTTPHMETHPQRVALQAGSDIIAASLS